MLARVETFEGGTADGIQAAAEQLRANAAQGPPAGIQGSDGLTMLIDRDGGRVMTLALFKSEADLRASEPALAQMEPPDGMGKSVSIDVFELAAEIRR